MAQAAALGSVAALGRGFTQLDNARKLGLLAGLAAIVAIAAVLLMYGRTPEYRVLFANVNDRDGGAIVGALSQMNVPYRMADGGGAILVPDNVVYETRLKLAAQGLPKGGGVGFELMENQKFGTSQFVEQVNYQRALEGELARTVQAVASVEAARVHLAIPRPSVFVRDTQKPSASVMLQTAPGRTLDAAQVAGIVHLVSSSVPELSPRAVTVVDQAGNLLTTPADGDGPGRIGLDATQIKYVQGLEATIAGRIESILRPITGPENVRAQVAASLDFSESEQTSETWKPNADPKDQAVRSQQVAETSTPSPVAPAPLGIPGALSNTPPGAGTAPIVAPVPPQTNPQAARPGQNAAAGAAAAPVVAPPPPPATTRDQTINYELDKTIRHTRNETGVVKRLSVAVVVNYRRTTDNAGKPKLEPLSEKELAQVTDLAREAMGFDKARGDSLNVVNAPFLGAGEVLEGASPWKDVVGELTSPASVATIGKWVVVVALLLVIVFAVIRPILRDLAQSGRRPPELPPMTLPDPAQPPGTVMINGVAVPVNQAVGGTYGKAGMDAAEEAYEADLKAVRDIAQQDPRIVAQVVKDWVGRDE
ncbi:MAG: flagellar M-ring protein FliF [Burkholderiales bacterium]|jgi:flagellar M-ring protein FliF|nr:flagellar M-ring protein FliF [Burkholderiales bacterium]